MGLLYFTVLVISAAATFLVTVWYQSHAQYSEVAAAGDVMNTANRSSYNEQADKRNIGANITESSEPDIQRDTAALDVLHIEMLVVLGMDPNYITPLWRVRSTITAVQNDHFTRDTNPYIQLHLVDYLELDFHQIPDNMTIEDAHVMIQKQLPKRPHHDALLLVTSRSIINNDQYTLFTVDSTVCGDDDLLVVSNWMLDHHATLTSTSPVQRKQLGRTKLSTVIAGALTYYLAGAEALHIACNDGWNVIDSPARCQFAAIQRRHNHQLDCFRQKQSTKTMAMDLLPQQSPIKPYSFAGLYPI